MNLKSQHVGNGRYELQAVVGKGGQAVVYRAVDLTRRATVAIKAIERGTNHNGNKKGSIQKKIPKPKNGSDVEEDEPPHDDDTNDNDDVKEESGGVSAQDTALVEDLEREVQILRSLDNKHIIRYLDEYRTDTHLYIVIEYAENGSLLGMLRRSTKERAFSEITAASYTKQILSGLKYLHEQGVLHRDIKAANVLVNSENIIKLSDFGLASLFESKSKRTAIRADGKEETTSTSSTTPPSPLVGSVYWMAPEVIRGEHLTEEADVWSLGCLVVELLTGNPLFYDRTPANAMYCIADCTETPPLPQFAPTPSLSEGSCASVLIGDASEQSGDSDIGIPAGYSPLSVDCRDFLKRCLQPDPEERWSVARLEHHPWVLKFGSDEINFIPQSPSATHVDAVADSNVSPQQQHPPEDVSTAKPASVDGAQRTTSTSNHTIMGSGGSTNDPSQANDGSLSLNSTSNNVVTPINNNHPPQPVPQQQQPVAAFTPSPLDIVVNNKHAFPPNSPPGTVSRTVEAMLFGEKESRELWLQEAGLYHVNSALSVVSAEESFSILRSLAFAAERLAGSPTLFFLSLSQTSFWDQDLTVLGSRESLAALWCYCCCLQDPSVPNTQYAGSQRNALLLLLTGESAKECTDVLYTLVCGPLPQEGDEASNHLTNGTSGDGGRGASNNNSASTGATRHGATGSYGGSPFGGVGVGRGSVLFGGGGGGASQQQYNVGGGGGGGNAVGGMLGDRTAAAFALGKLQSSSGSSQRCSHTRRRMRSDGGVAGAVVQVIESVCTESFASGTTPVHGWPWVDKLYSVLHALVSALPTKAAAVTDRWIVALQEAANHRCQSAIALFVKIVHEQPRLVARELTVRTFLNIVVDTSLDYMLRVDVMRCFPVLQASSAACATSLEDISCSVPLLALAATSGVPLNERDHITSVVATLCEKRSMAEVCSAYPRLRTAALSKLHKAMGEKDASEMRAAIKLLTLLFSNSENPTEYTNARELLRTVAIVVQSYGDVFPRDVMIAAQQLQDSLGAQTIFL